MIRFNVSSTRAHLATLRENTTFVGRRRMNKQIAKLFAKAGVAMEGKAWRSAQAAYVNGGLKAAQKFIAKQA